MQHFHGPLFPDGLFHVFNRANGSERLFKCSENYYFFLEKYNHYISPVAQTLAWCLLANHYHFLIRIKPSATLKELVEQGKKKQLEKEDALSGFVIQQFSNWQNSYAKAFNKVYRRRGSLFMDYIRRVAVDKQNQLGHTVFYIHKNPVHHGFAETLDEWTFSSYHEYVSQRFWMVNSKEVLDWFGTTENFIRFHAQPIERKKA